MKHIKNLKNKILVVAIKSVLSIALIATSTAVTTIAVTSTLAEYGDVIVTNNEVTQPLEVERFKQFKRT